ncbi:hypothetical protein BGZ63DRAFT_459488 [Mariannaea sp. PMI_226]|nr:hypothetical protein BGZ63DRAFT_459488 [Mariannaea sp. PMI_226]
MANQGRIFALGQSVPFLLHPSSSLPPSWCYVGPGYLRGKKAVCQRKEKYYSSIVRGGQARVPGSARTRTYYVAEEWDFLHQLGNYDTPRSRGFCQPIAVNRCRCGACASGSQLADANRMLRTDTSLERATETYPPCWFDPNSETGPYNADEENEREEDKGQRSCLVAVGAWLLRRTVCQLQAIARDYYWPMPEEQCYPHKTQSIRWLTIVIFASNQHNTWMSRSRTFTMVDACAMHSKAVLLWRRTVQNARMPAFI